MLNHGGIEADRHRRPACHCTAAGVRDDLLAQFARSCGQAWTQTGDRPKQVHGMGVLAQEVGSERSLCAAVTRRRLLMAAAPSRRSDSLLKLRRKLCDIADKVEPTVSVHASQCIGMHVVNALISAFPELGK